MATNKYYLQLEGIEGEVQDPGFLGAISVSSYSLYPAVSSNGPGAAAGRPILTMATFVMPYERSVPTLHLLAATGRYVKKGVITTVRNKSTVLVITLEFVKVMAVQTSDAGQVSDRPMIVLDIEFDKSTFKGAEPIPVQGSLGR